MSGMLDSGGGGSTSGGTSGNTDEGLWDDAFGSVDESVARSTDDQAGGGLMDGAADALDHGAGSTDEAVARSTDSTEGGGLWDGFTGTTDHGAGSTDESFARQFDDTAGGGFADEAGEAATSALTNLSTKQKAALGAAAFLVVALVLRPYAQMGAGVT